MVDDVIRKVVEERASSPAIQEMIEEQVMKIFDFEDALVEVVTDNVSSKDIEECVGVKLEELDVAQICEETLQQAIEDQVKTAVEELDVQGVVNDAVRDALVSQFKKY